MTIEPIPPAPLNPPLTPESAITDAARAYLEAETAYSAAFMRRRATEYALLAAAECGEDSDLCAVVVDKQAILLEDGRVKDIIDVIGGAS